MRYPIVRAFREHIPEPAARADWLRPWGCLCETTFQLHLFLHKLII